MGERGITLVELVVAMAILAILAGIAFPSISTWQEREGLSEGTMFLKSALSSARSRTIQDGLTCGCTPGVTCSASDVTGGCTTQLFGVQVDPGSNQVRLVRFCDANGDFCDGTTLPGAIDSGELSTIWSRNFSRYVAVNASDTTGDIDSKGLFFDKSGRVTGNGGASTFLTGGNNERCVVVSNTGRIREGVSDGAGSCD